MCSVHVHNKSYCSFIFLFPETVKLVVTVTVAVVANENSFLSNKAYVARNGDLKMMEFMFYNWYTYLKHGKPTSFFSRCFKS